MAEVHSIHIKVDSTDANKATNDLNKMAGATSNAEKALGNLIGVAKGLIALETLRRAASYAIEAADSFILMSSKLKLATSSQDEYNKAQAELFKISQANSTELASTVDLYARMSRGMKDMGKSQDDILKMTNAVGQALKISGASTSEASSVITQFGQALGSGVLRGEEFNAIMENGNRLARALADGLGVPLGSLRKLAEQGQLTGDIVTKAILSQTSALEAEASTMQTTVNQAWTQFENDITMTIGKANEMSGASKDLIELLKIMEPMLISVAERGMKVFSLAIEGVTGSMLGLRGVMGELYDMIPAFAANLAKLKGQQVPVDPEIEKLMKMGQGKASLEEIAGKPAQLAEKASAKVEVALAKSSKAAKKAADDAQRAFQETINANVKAAENAASLQDAIAETSRKRLENELDAAKEKARLDSKETNSYEEKLRIAEELQKKSEEIIAAETQLRLDALDREEAIVDAKIAGVEREIEAAGRYNLSQAERIRLESELATLQTQKQIIPEERTQIELDAIKQLSAATEELNGLRRGGEESVRDEALRTLAVMESNLDFAKEMATGFTEAFGQIGEAIGGAVVALSEYEKQMATIQVQMEEELVKRQKEIAKNPAVRYEIEQKAAEKSAKAQVKAYGDMAQAAQGFFTKGSKGYEAMGAAVKVFRAVEMVQSAMSAAQQLDDIAKGVAAFIAGQTTKAAASAATLPTVISTEAGKQIAYSKTAIAAQGSVPIAGFALMAAMAALLLSYGISSGGGGGGTPVPEAGTGTVLGDPTKQSESIGNALGLLVEINSNDLAYSADMLESLRNIESALADASALIAKQVMPIIGQLVSNSGVSSMMSSKQVTEAGFLIPGKLLTEILKSKTLEGFMGARTESSTGLFGEWKSSNTQIAPYSKEIAKAFGRIVDEVYSTVVSAADKIGISMQTIEERAKGLKIGLGKINLAGKSAEEAAKAVEAAVSSMSDKMAMKLLPEFKDFQRNGEGYYETMIRVGAGIADATGKLEQMGMEAISYTKIDEKKGDVAAEIARQTLIAQGHLSDGAKEYVHQLTGSIDDIIEAYKQLIDVQNSLRVIGDAAKDLDRTMINAAGGLSAFQEALTTFIDEFMTPTDKVKGQAMALADQFKNLGYAMPLSRDAFRDLVQSIDTTTEAGKKAYGSLIALSPAFADYINNLEDLQSTMRELQNSVSDLMQSIKSDIAGLTSTSAVAGLASENVADAWSKVNDYIKTIQDGAERNVTTEIDLLSGLRSAVMSRYSAELARLQEAARAQAEAIKTASSAQIEAIKSGVDAQIEALNNASQAQIETIQANLDIELEAKQKAHDAALKALQAELDAANKLKNAVDQVRQYAAGMALGPNAPSSPEQRLSEAQRQYTEFLRRAQSGDADAIGQLSGAADAYLQASKDYYGSGTQYSNIFDGVKQAMEAIGAMDVADPDSIQSKIDELRESQADELQAIRDRAERQISQIKDSTKDQIAALKSAADDQIKAIQQATNDQVAALTDPDQNGAIAALKADTIAELQRIYELSQKVQEEANRQAEEVNRISNDQLIEMQKQTSYLATIAGNNPTTPNAAPDTAPSGNTSALNATMKNVATETRASVNLQKNAYPQMIDKLNSIDDRLSKIERTQRLNA